MFVRVLIILLLFLANPCFAQTWNNPHKKTENNNVRYGAFAGSPKSLDLAKAYSSDELQFVAQIYEPPLQYHYLKRPYTLVPLTLSAMPTVTFYDKSGNKLPNNVNPKKVAYTIYDLKIKPGILYQPHPAFAKDKNGHYHYLNLSQNQLEKIKHLKDFKYKGTRELTASDYAYQIKRLAHPGISSPILGLMKNHIVGLKEYAKKLQTEYNKLTKQGIEPYLDLRQHPLEGVKVLGPYHYQIKIKGVYPQFIYWLAMPFFAPIPWEADKFYAQRGLKEKNITLSWHPVGTGPYYLSKNNPNGEMILERNPNFHGEKYPNEGTQKDKVNGYLADANKALPFIDKFVFSLDKESIPRWNKFLQGYYDVSGISADSFDQAIKIDRNGKPVLTPELKKKGIRLQTTVSPAVFYIGFNMLDDVVGGLGEKQKKLRQAISIAIDYEEYISIFMNGRGIAAQGPIPPGIFGYTDGKAGINHVVYVWDGKRAKRKPLQYAKKLLAEAGYPGGINPKTGKPLILNYDAASTGSPDDKARFNWLRKQFAKLGIQLNIRSTQYNRFRDKVRTGSAQIFSWGWLADYPDPENFLFLLYGPNGKVKHGGENATNYYNPKFDKLFEEIKNMPNGPARLKKIQQAIKILREDSPWFWGVNPINFTLSHQWNRPTKPNAMANNTLKYEKLNPEQRHKLRKQWNKPILWPLAIVLLLIILLAIPLIIIYWQREHRPQVKRNKLDP